MWRVPTVSKVYAGQEGDRESICSTFYDEKKNPPRAQYTLHTHTGTTGARTRTHVQWSVLFCLYYFPTATMQGNEIPSSTQYIHV